LCLFDSDVIAEEIGGGQRPIIGLQGKSRLISHQVSFA
jgi:hypothetical protein